MASYFLDIKEEKITISGEISIISKNRRFRFYLVDFLDAKFVNEKNLIIIPCNSKNKDTAIKIIQAFEKYKLAIEYSDRVSQLIQFYNKEIESFEIFSSKALSIRENKCEVKDINEFHENISNVFIRKMYPLQLLSAYHLAFSQNACNFSVPGSGKTTIVYGAYAHLKETSDKSKNVSKLLVIGPLSSFSPWEEEYLECFGKKVHSKRLTGVNALERNDYFSSSETAELVLMSYQSIPSTLRGINHFLSRYDVMVVLDEAHKIKNAEGGLWAQSTLSFAEKAKSRVVLTGTPAPNGYQDLFNLYKFIWPNKDIIKYKLYQLQDMSSNSKDSRVENLIRNISPFFVRIRKSHLPDLPKINEHEAVRCEMGPIQREIYDFIEEKYMNYFSNHESNTDLKNVLVRARLIRLMQAATNPALLSKPILEFQSQGSNNNDLYTFSEKENKKVEFSDFNSNYDEFNDLTETSYSLESEIAHISNKNFILNIDIYRKILNYHELEVPSKYMEIYNLVNKIVTTKKEKVIIWTTFVENIFQLQKYLESKGINSESLHGGVAVENENTQSNELTREKIIKRFHKDDSSFSVLIANPFAVGESISLHKACNNAIYLERTFNAAHFIQSKDRIHRVGGDSTLNTNYYYINSLNSIDETIHFRLNEKTERMNEIMEKMPIPLFEENLNFESDYSTDIKTLLNEYYLRKS